jgi:arylsulfate sulfotransferase
LRNTGVEVLDLVGAANIPVITDLDGNVIWYYPFNATIGVPAGSSSSWVMPIKLLDNGDFLLLVGTDILREIDLTGATVRETNIATINQGLVKKRLGLQVGGMHHDFLLLPNGHVMVLCFVFQFVKTQDYPQGINVTGDALIELDDNWNPVWAWNGFDHLDVNRHPWFGLPDWTHSNAVIYDTRDKNVIVSSRHQNWIFKIDYRDGSGKGGILWRLGYQGDFTLIGGGPADWFWAQHYPSFVSTNKDMTSRVAVFDDGDFRTNDVGQTCPVAVACYSRAVIFNIDEKAKTASVSWQYNTGIYTPWGGSIQVLPVTGHVEYAASSIGGASVGAVSEITQDPAPYFIWQMYTPAPMYRGHRIPSLYPGVNWYQ